MPILSEKYQNSRWPMHYDEIRQVLGLPKKLPDNLTTRYWIVQGYNVKLIPQGPPKIDRWGRPDRRMKHRLLAECKGCGCWVSFGRLRQHEQGCKQLKDNTTI